MSSYGDQPLLQPAAAQLANAMVAVLGPQFTLGSMAYSRCKTLVTDNTGEAVCALGWLAVCLAAGWLGGWVDGWVGRLSGSLLVLALKQPTFLQ